MKKLAWSETYRQAGVVLATLGGFILSVIIVLVIYAYQQDQAHEDAPKPAAQLAGSIDHIWLDVPPLDAEGKIGGIAPPPIAPVQEMEEGAVASVGTPAPSLPPQTALQEQPAGQAQETAPVAEEAGADEAGADEAVADGAVTPAVEPAPQAAPAPASETTPNPTSEPDGRAEHVSAAPSGAAAEKAPAGPPNDVFAVLLGGGDDPRLLEAMPSGTAVVLGVIDDRTAAFVGQAHGRGITVYLPLPVAESGPLPSLSAEPEENRQRFVAFLEQLPPVDGLYIPEGHPFNKDMASFAALLEEAKEQGLNVIGTIPPNLQAPTTPLPAHHAVDVQMLSGDAANIEDVLFVLTSDRTGVTVVTGPAELAFAKALTKVAAEDLGYRFTLPEGF